MGLLIELYSYIYNKFDLSIVFHKHYDTSIYSYKIICLLLFVIN